MQVCNALYKFQKSNFAIKIFSDQLSAVESCAARTEQEMFVRTFIRSGHERKSDRHFSVSCLRHFPSESLGLRVFSARPSCLTRRRRD